MRRTNTSAVAAYALSCIAVAVAAGAALAALGAQAGVPAVVVAGIALVGLLAPYALPSSRWQVPQHWGGPNPWRNGAAFGAPLGAGFLTILPGPGLYSVAAACLVVPLPLAAGIYGAFGLARSAPVVLAWARPYRDELEGLTIDRLAGGAAFRRAEIVLLAALATAALLAV